MVDNSPDVEGQGGSRPSFMTFWKKGKQKITGKGSSASPESAGAEYSPTDNGKPLEFIYLCLSVSIVLQSYFGLWQ